MMNNNSKKASNYNEYNFDGLVGPTHNYAGLALGNIASSKNKDAESNPKTAALQGLSKMKHLFDLGLKQGVLPPQPRPDLEFLKTIGFIGKTEKLLKQALDYSPKLFSASYSASAMWTANAATIAPSPDTQDNIVHITPANLAYNLHRTIEADVSYNVLKKIFEDEKYFTVHKYLQQSNVFGDEGAANHTRLCSDYGSKGVGLFVYGQEYYNKQALRPKNFPARQTLEASQAVARQHNLDDKKVMFLQQNPEAIDAGCFHNDVCAVGNQNILLCHEIAFVDQENNLNKLRKICEVNKISLNVYTIAKNDLSVEDMVSSYLFNSQLIVIDGKTTLVSPKECYTNENAHKVISSMVADQNNLINQVIYVDCRQSMRNGGGPACLRLRVVLSDEEVQAINSNNILTLDLYHKLEKWINKHYRDKLVLKDLLDPKLVDESYTALDELTKILELGSVYKFQQI